MKYKIFDNKILVLLICLSILFIHTNGIRAGLSFGGNRRNALGYNLGFGGNGVAYRYFFNDRDGFQITGSVLGDAEEINYNVGILYNRILHQSYENRLSVTPGFSMGNEHFVLGSVIEVEFDPGWFEGISTGISGGYQIGWNNLHEEEWDFSIRPTVGISLFYNF